MKELLYKCLLEEGKLYQQLLNTLDKKAKVLMDSNKKENIHLMSEESSLLQCISACEEKRNSYLKLLGYATDHTGLKLFCLDNNEFERSFKKIEKFKKFCRWQKEINQTLDRFHQEYKKAEDKE